MKKIAILGCENSHANAFLQFIQEKEEFKDIEVFGVYSNDPEASRKLNEKFGVPVMAEYTDAVGKVDGIVITARHGGNHYPYAKPYIDSGIPMFIDKPITVSEEEVVEFLGILKSRNIPVTGGSSLRHASTILEIEEHCKQETNGRTVGGIVRAPLSTDNIYGGFFFYSQHLVEMACQAFGRYPKSVRVVMDDNRNRTVLFNYGDYIVTGLYTEGGGGSYYAARFAHKGTQGDIIPASEDKLWYYEEFKEFVSTMDGVPQPMSYEDFAAPVFILNAIDRASRSGAEEPVNYQSL